MTSVWPALWPPWKRTTMSACSDNQSTILPFPSSPHWAPTTTTLAISREFLAARDHTPSLKHGRGRSDARQPNRIKDAGGRSKQEAGFDAHPDGHQAIDIHGKFELLINPQAPKL